MIATFMNGLRYNQIVAGLESTSKIVVKFTMFCNRIYMVAKLEIKVVK